MFRFHFPPRPCKNNLSETFFFINDGAPFVYLKHVTCIMDCKYLGLRTKTLDSETLNPDSLRVLNIRGEELLFRSIFLYILCQSVICLFKAKYHMYYILNSGLNFLTFKHLILIRVWVLEVSTSHPWDHSVLFTNRSPLQPTPRKK